MSLGRVELAAMMTARRTELAERITREVTTELPSYAGIDRGSVQEMSARAVDILIMAVGDRRPLSVDDRALMVQYGGLRAAQGVGLEDVYQAWRRAVHTLIDELVELSDSDRVALQLTRALLDRVDEATVAFTSGYHAADRDRVRTDELLRSRFILDLLGGRLGAQEIKRGAAQHGLDHGREYAALHTRGLRDLHDSTLRERLVSAGGGRRPLLTVDGADVVGIIAPGLEVEYDDAIGVGPAVALDDLALSFRLASRALSTAEAGGYTGVQSLGTLGLRLAVSGDPDLGEALVREVIPRLGAAENAAAVAQTVRLYLASGAKADMVASELFVHQNTVRYRLSRFQELTGLDLRRPEDAFRAWWAVEVWSQRENAEVRP